MACAGAGAALYLCPVYGDTTRRLAYRYIHVYVHEFIMCQYRVCCIVYFSAASLSRIISYCTAYTYYIYIHTILYIYIYIYISDHGLTCGYMQAAAHGYTCGYARGHA